MWTPFGAKPGRRWLTAPLWLPLAGLAWLFAALAVTAGMLAELLSGEGW